MFWQYLVSDRCMSDECVLLQAAVAAINKVKDAVNFRQWTARGKGLVLLNILVRPRLPKAWVAQKTPAALIARTLYNMCLGLNFPLTSP